MESRKRKREPEAPRIKYHVEQLGRSFERILKEDSRQELREVVRKKLGLDQNTQLDLVQVREGKLYDLEDEDDFEAFQAAAFAYSSLDVRVSFSQDPSAQNLRSGLARSFSQLSASRAPVPGPSSEPSSPRNRRKKQKRNVSLVDQSTRDGSIVPSPGVDDDRSESIHGTLVIPPLDHEVPPAPLKKKRKTNPVELQGSATEGAPLPKKRKSSKGKESEDPMPSSAAPTEKELEQELPKKKKQKKTKDKEGISSPQEEQAPAPAVPPAPATETAVPDPGLTVKHKSKKAKEKKPSPEDAAVTQADSTGLTPAPAKPPKTKKNKEKSVAGKDGQANAIQAQGTHISVGAASTSAPPAPAARKSASSKSSPSVNPQPVSNLSTSSTVQSTIAEFLKKPPLSAAEILASFASSPFSDADEGSEGDDEREPKTVMVEAVKPAKTKKKKKAMPESKAVGSIAEGKPKAKAQVKPKKSRLNESWVPDDTGDVASIPPPTQRSSIITENSNADTIPVPPPTNPPLPTRARSKLSKSPSKPNQSCPVCLSSPFHYRFQCPVIQAGADAIRPRITELRKEGGKEDLVGELEDWVKKDEEKRKEKPAPAPTVDLRKIASPPAPGRSPGNLKTVFSWPSVAQNSPPPSWTPMVPLESQPSEVTIESRDEGSSEESASSEFESEQQGSGKIRPSTPGPASESESESGSDSESSGDHVAQPIEDIEDVDLDALIRGPTLKAPSAVLAKLADESDKEKERAKRAKDDEDVDDAGLLEEEDDEEKERRPKGWKPARSSSPAVEDDEDESDTDGGPDAKQTAGDSGPAVRSTAVDTRPVDIDIPPPEGPGVPGEGVQDEEEAGESGANLSTSAELVLDLGPKLLQASPPRGSPASSQTRSPSLEILAIGEGKGPTPDAMDVDNVESASHGPLARPEDPPHDDNFLDPTVPSQPELQSTPSTPRATTPAFPMTPQSRAAPGTPSTVQRMKDRHGRRPLSSQDDEIDVDGAPQPGPLDLTEIPGLISQDEEEAVAEKPKRGRSRAPSKSQSTRQAQSRSATAPPPDSNVSTSTRNTRSASQEAPKVRRGRPPLTEAIKAERKAIKDAEKAAKAAERRAKATEKKKGGPAPQKSRKKAGDPKPAVSPEAPPSSQDVPSTSPAALPPAVVTPIPLSQWKTLPPPTVSSLISRSSPAFDQLVSSSPAGGSAMSDPTEQPAENRFAVPGGLDGMKSPTSTSRKHDEDDVEQLVGSTKAAEKIHHPSRQPLFLPGASQMTQSQTVPRFLSLAASDEATQEPAVDERERSASDPLSHTEPESADETSQKATIPRPRLPSKSTFPSLSQLSFEKFRPSFLLSGRVFNQNKEKEQSIPQPDEDSESEEDESSDEEKQSHIPKGRRAGTGVVKKRKSRGLLHA